MLRAGATLAGLTAILAALVGGCAGAASTLAPRGHGADRIAALAWVLFGVGAVVYVAVVVALAVAAFRPRADARAAAPGSPAERAEARSDRLILAASAGVTSLVVGALILLTLLTVNTLSRHDPPSLTVRVIGHQWWWEIHYPADGVVTANEVHVPVGETIRLELGASDVIHSFWVPALHGKLDLIPGRENVLHLMAREAGVYRGQCAEYCGLQHARMAFLVVAEEPARFRAWLARQREAALPPGEPVRQQGEQVFLQWCLACHTVRGTPAAGQLGPDLTHVASRRTLGAGILPTTPGNLAAWIADPQRLKPGNRMPVLPLDPEAVRAVAAYLAGLT